MSESSSGKSNTCGRTPRTSYGSDLLNPNISDTALAAASNKDLLIRDLVAFHEWDGHDQSIYPGHNDMARLASKVDQRKRDRWGKRHPYAWSYPCRLWEYHEEGELRVDDLMPRDLMWRRPDNDSHQWGWCRVHNVMEVDGIVDVQADVLWINGSAAFCGDMIFGLGDTVRGRRWREPQE